MSDAINYSQQVDTRQSGVQNEALAVWKQRSMLIPYSHYYNRHSPTTTTAINRINAAATITFTTTTTNNNNNNNKGKGTVQPRTGHKGPEGE
jgi:aromatic ring hydroxylase